MRSHWMYYMIQNKSLYRQYNELLEQYRRRVSAATAPRPAAAAATAPPAAATADTNFPTLPAF